jgi:hypothetical protein
MKVKVPDGAFIFFFGGGNYRSASCTAWTAAGPRRRTAFRDNFLDGRITPGWLWGNAEARNRGLKSVRTKVVPAKAETHAFPPIS